jgi:hypothetical protein
MLSAASLRMRRNTPILAEGAAIPSLQTHRQRWVLLLKRHEQGVVEQGGGGQPQTDTIMGCAVGRGYTLPLNTCKLSMGMRAPHVRLLPERCALLMQLTEWSKRSADAEEIKQNCAHACGVLQAKIEVRLTPLPARGWTRATDTPHAP